MISSFDRTQSQVMVNSFVRSVYNWMAIGLALTGFIAFLVASNETLFRAIYPFKWILFIGEIALVYFLAARVHKMEASTATGMFLLYSALNGATLSVIFYAYTMSSIASTFFICAGTFIACSIFGWTTKKDLTSLGGFMFMGLIGCIIATIVNLIFIRSAGMSMIVSYLLVFIFVGLTAYDTQKLKTMAMTQPDGLDGAAIRKGAIVGALTLYLDFINLFINLLFIFGGSRD